MTKHNIMRIPLGIMLAVALILTLLGGFAPAAEAATVPQASISVPKVTAAQTQAVAVGNVTCQNLVATARTRVRQYTTDKWRDFYVKVEQGYQSCLVRKGKDFLRPTWYKYSYDAGGRILCDWTTLFIPNGLHNVKFRSHFYNYNGGRVKSMGQIGVSCDPDGKKTLDGRFGQRTSPILYWVNSSRSGSPRMYVTVGVDWRAPLGRTDGYGSMSQYMFPTRG